eukprot:GEMP01000113.1.p1 GENE.GEMP01000113.1~~GEMP01000113.1.p1  ORF type:complete len:3261 (+),score=762.43 GEMP01000113.1:130-9912(+)
MVPWAFNAALPLWVCLKQDCRLSVGTHIAAVSFTNDDGSAVAAACSAGAASDVEIPAACGALTPPAFGTYAICDANVTNAPVAALVVVGTDTTSVACQTLQDCSFTLTGFGLEGVFVDGCSTSGTDSCTASEIAWGEFNDVTSLTWGPEVLTSGIHKVCIMSQSALNLIVTGPDSVGDLSLTRGDGASLSVSQYNVASNPGLLLCDNTHTDCTTCFNAADGTSGRIAWTAAGTWGFIITPAVPGSSYVVCFGETALGTASVRGPGDAFTLPDLITGKRALLTLTGINLANTDQVFVGSWQATSNAADGTTWLVPLLAAGDHMVKWNNVELGDVTVAGADLTAACLGLQSTCSIEGAPEFEDYDIQLSIGNADCSSLIETSTRQRGNETFSITHPGTGVFTVCIDIDLAVPSGLLRALDLAAKNDVAIFGHPYVVPSFQGSAAGDKVLIVETPNDCAAAAAVLSARDVGVGTVEGLQSGVLGLCYLPNGLAQDRAEPIGEVTVRGPFPQNITCILGTPCVFQLDGQDLAHGSIHAYAGIASTCPIPNYAPFRAASLSQEFDFGIYRARQDFKLCWGHFAQHSELIETGELRFDGPDPAVTEVRCSWGTACTWDVPFAIDGTAGPCMDKHTAYATTTDNGTAHLTADIPAGTHPLCWGERPPHVVPFVHLILEGPIAGADIACRIDDVTSCLGRSVEFAVPSVIPVVIAVECGDSAGRYDADVPGSYKLCFNDREFGSIAIAGPFMARTYACDAGAPCNIDIDGFGIFQVATTAFAIDPAGNATCADGPPTNGTLADQCCAVSSIDADNNHIWGTQYHFGVPTLVGAYTLCWEDRDVGTLAIYGPQSYPVQAFTCTLGHACSFTIAYFNDTLYTYEDDVSICHTAGSVVDTTKVVNPAGVLYDLCWRGFPFGTVDVRGPIARNYTCSARSPCTLADLESEWSADVTLANGGAVTSATAVSHSPYTVVFFTVPVGSLLMIGPNANALYTCTASASAACTVEIEMFGAQDSAAQSYFTQLGTCDGMYTAASGSDDFVFVFNGIAIGHIGRALCMDDDVPAGTLHIIGPTGYTVFPTVPLIGTTPTITFTGVEVTNGQFTLDTDWQTGGPVSVMWNNDIVVGLPIDVRGPSAVRTVAVSGGATVVPVVGVTFDLVMDGHLLSASDTVTMVGPLIITPWSLYSGTSFAIRLQAHEVRPFTVEWNGIVMGTIDVGGPAEPWSLTSAYVGEVVDVPAGWYVAAASSCALVNPTSSVPSSAVFYEPGSVSACWCAFPCDVFVRMHGVTIRGVTAMSFTRQPIPRVGAMEPFTVDTANAAVCFEPDGGSTEVECSNCTVFGWSSNNTVQFHHVGTYRLCSRDATATAGAPYVAATPAIVVTPYLLQLDVTTIVAKAGTPVSIPIPEGVLFLNTFQGPTFTLPLGGVYTVAWQSDGSGSVPITLGAIEVDGPLSNGTLAMCSRYEACNVTVVGINLSEEDDTWMLCTSGDSVDILPTNSTNNNETNSTMREVRLQVAPLGDIGLVSLCWEGIPAGQIDIAGLAISMAVVNDTVECTAGIRCFPQLTGRAATHVAVKPPGCAQKDSFIVPPSVVSHGQTEVTFPLGGGAWDLCACVHPVCTLPSHFTSRAGSIHAYAPTPELRTVECHSGVPCTVDVNDNNNTEGTGYWVTHFDACATLDATAAMNMTFGMLDAGEYNVCWALELPHWVYIGHLKVSGPRMVPGGQIFTCSWPHCRVLLDALLPPKNHVFTVHAGTYASHSRLRRVFSWDETLPGGDYDLTWASSSGEVITFGMLRVWGPFINQAIECHAGEMCVFVLDGLFADGPIPVLRVPCGDARRILHDDDGAPRDEDNGGGNGTTSGWPAYTLHSDFPATTYGMCACPANGGACLDIGVVTVLGVREAGTVIDAYTNEPLEVTLSGDIPVGSFLSIGTARSVKLNNTDGVFSIPIVDILGGSYALYWDDGGARVQVGTVAVVGPQADEHTCVSTDDCLLTINGTWDQPFGSLTVKHDCDDDEGVVGMHYAVEVGTPWTNLARSDPGFRICWNADHRPGDLSLYRLDVGLVRVRGPVEGRYTWQRSFGSPGKDRALTITSVPAFDLYPLSDYSSVIGGFAGKGGTALTAENVPCHWIRTPLVQNYFSKMCAYSQDHAGNGPDNDGFIWKLGYNGTTLWRYHFGAPDADDEITAIASLKNTGGLVIGGHTNGLVIPSSDPDGPEPYAHNGMQDIFLAILTSNGQLVRTVQFGSDEDDFCTGVVEYNGDIYVLAVSGRPFFNSANDMGLETIVARLHMEFYVQDVRYISSRKDERGHILLVDAEGYVYVAGETNGLPLSDRANGKWDYFVAKFDFRDSRPTPILSFQHGSSEDDVLSGMTLDVDGHLYLCGSTMGVLVPRRSNLWDVFVVKLDKDTLQPQWTRQYGSYRNEYGMGIAPIWSMRGPNDTEFVIAGYSDSDWPTDLDPSSEAYNSKADSWYVFLDAEGTITRKYKMETQTRDYVMSVTGDARNGHVVFAGYSDGPSDGLNGPVPHNGLEDVNVWQVDLRPYIVCAVQQACNLTLPPVDSDRQLLIDPGLLDDPDNFLGVSQHPRCMLSTIEDIAMLPVGHHTLCYCQRNNTACLSLGVFQLRGPFFDQHYTCVAGKVCYLDGVQGVGLGNEDYVAIMDTCSRVDDNHPVPGFNTLLSATSRIINATKHTVCEIGELGAFGCQAIRAASGVYSLCYCSGSVSTTPTHRMCSTPSDFHVHFGTLTIVGPAFGQRRRCLYGEVDCRLIDLAGTSMGVSSRIITSPLCGVSTPSSFSTPLAGQLPSSGFVGFPYTGVWERIALDIPNNYEFARPTDEDLLRKHTNVVLAAPGIYPLCYCPGEQCDRMADFAVPFGEFVVAANFAVRNVSGIRTKEWPPRCLRGRECRVDVVGDHYFPDDTIMALDYKCSDHEAAGIGASNPFGAHANASNQYFTWGTQNVLLNVKPRLYSICWCGSTICADASNYRYRIGSVVVAGKSDLALPTFISTISNALEESSIDIYGLRLQDELAILGAFSDDVFAQPYLLINLEELEEGSTLVLNAGLVRGRFRWTVVPVPGEFDVHFIPYGGDRSALDVVARFRNEGPYLGQNFNCVLGMYCEATLDGVGLLDGDIVGVCSGSWTTASDTGIAFPLAANIAKWAYVTDKPGIYELCWTRGVSMHFTPFATMDIYGPVPQNVSCASTTPCDVAFTTLGTKQGNATELLDIGVGQTFATSSEPSFQVDLTGSAMERYRDHPLYWGMDNAFRLPVGFIRLTT